MTQLPQPLSYGYPPRLPYLVCPQCGAELSPALLSCPRCHRLVYADRLNQLAAEAKAAADAGDGAAELERRREMLRLLPRESKQFAAVAERVAELSRTVEANAPGGAADWRSRAMGRRITGIGSLLLFLLAGLSKASTFASMLVFAGVYWQIYGWKLALGIVLSIYVHEMGHVAELLRYGVRASAPMFIPGLGAVIMLKQHPADPRQDARIGLAGPTWGLGAALVACAGWALFKWPSWVATAQLGAWLNLFNLTPIWQLDGSRGFRALSIPQRWLVVLAVGGSYAAISTTLGTWQGYHALLAVVGAVVVLRSVSEAKPERASGDGFATVQFIILVVALSALSTLRVPGVTDRR